MIVWELVKIEGSRLKMDERLRVLDPSPRHYIKSTLAYDVDDKLVVDGFIGPYQLVLNKVELVDISSKENFSPCLPGIKSESSTNPTFTNSKHRNRRHSKSIVERISIPIVTMADNRTMEEMLQAPTEGYGDAIVVPDILAENFEIRTGLLIDSSKQISCDVESVNQIDVIDVAYEEYVQEVLRFSKIPKSGNPTPTLDPIISSSSPSFTPFEGSDSILEEIETFLRTLDELSNLDDDYYATEGDILYLEKLLNEDPSPNLPPVKTEDLKQVDATLTKPFN
nr:reverse transcriptase domain-containing protein [Tanacetum cinerariifolium]